MSTLNFNQLWAEENFDAMEKSGYVAQYKLKDSRNKSFEYLWEVQLAEIALNFHGNKHICETVIRTLMTHKLKVGSRHMDNRNAILQRRKKGSAAAEEKITDLEASENTNLEPEIDISKLVLFDTILDVVCHVLMVKKTGCTFTKIHKACKSMFLRLKSKPKVEISIFEIQEATDEALGMTGPDAILYRQNALERKSFLYDLVSRRNTTPEPTVFNNMKGIAINILARNEGNPLTAEKIYSEAVKRNLTYKLGRKSRAIPVSSASVIENCLLMLTGKVQHGNGAARCGVIRDSFNSENIPLFIIKEKRAEKKDMVERRPKKRRKKN